MPRRGSSVASQLGLVGGHGSAPDSEDEAASPVAGASPAGRRRVSQEALKDQRRRSNAFNEGMGSPMIRKLQRGKKKKAPDTPPTPAERRRAASPENAAMPWYCGYKNSVKGAPGSPFSRASRYGFKGAMSLEHLERPQSTQGLQERRPDFLRASSPVDEYGPQLRSGPQHPWASPKMWPGNAQYTDSRQGALSASYNAQTTLGSHACSPCGRLQRHLEREQEELQRLKRAATAQRRLNMSRSGTPLPQLLQSPTTPSPQRRRKPRASPVVNIDPTRRVTYWRSFTVLSSDSSDLMASERAKEARARNEREAHYRSKWAELSSLLEVMKKPCHTKPGRRDVLELMAGLKETSIENTHRNVISRDQFVRLVVHQYDSASVRCLHRIFSCFDLAKTERVDYREVSGVLSGLRFPTEDLALLGQLFEIFEADADGTVSFEELKTIFTMFTASDVELRGILRKFEEAFGARDAEARLTREDFDQALEAHGALAERFGMTAQARQAELRS